MLIISESEQTRRTLSRALGDGDLELIATLRSPLFALPVLAQRWPDVVVLDRPCDEGLAFLRRLTRLRPTPVIVTVAACDDAGLEVHALAAGAVAVVARDALGESSLAAIVRAVAPGPRRASTQAANEAWAWEFAS